MRVLRGTLTFVLGMIIGIILFVVAIGGTLVILATQMTVGQIQQAVIGSDSVISSDSEIYDKTLLDTVQGVISDVQNFDKLSLKTLYEHYGIKLLNGISGIDFTTKDFYSVPIPDLINDLSIVVNSFTLNDVGKIAGVDFASYGLPILTNNLDNNISTALNNVLGSINGDLSMRAIDTNLGINLGTADNTLLATLQDVVLSEFGNVLNVLRVNSILESDTDTFIPSDSTARKYFVKTDVYEAIPASELNSNNITLGAETSLIGGIDTDGDGKADKMNTVETRYVQMKKNVEGEEVISYAVDNSTYNENFDFENNNKTFYRHIIYTATNKTSGEGVYMLCYANRVDSVNGDDYTLVEKGFVPVDELEFNSDLWAMTGDVLDSDSKLGQLEEDQEFEGKTFERVHVGSSTRLLQSIAHMTISELQNADNLLEGLTISDIIEITPDTARIIKSLAARNCKILELGTVANDLTLGEMIDIATYRYEENSNGKFVRIEDEKSFTVYDKENADMAGLTRYKKTADGEYVEDANGKFVHSVYYTLYNPADPKQADSTRYNRAALEDGETASSALLQRFVGATLGGFSDAFDSLMLADVLQIDADIYEQIDPSTINDKGTERYFRYDEELGVYRVVNLDYINEHPLLTYYHISYSGESTTFMKKLAYVKIDDMANAMEAVIDDMMLSEFVDVFTEDAVELTPHTLPVSENPLSADKKYFVEFGVDGNEYQTETLDENGSKITTNYVYVYDLYGDYAKANFRAVDVTENITETPIFFKYTSFSTLDILADAAKIEGLLAKGNMFYVDQNDGEYKQNYTLCMYLLTHNFRSRVYFRETSTGAGAVSGMMKTYTGNPTQYGLYVKDDFLGYLQYDATNPVFADRPLVTFEKSATDSFADMFFIDKSEVTYLKKHLDDKGFTTNGIYFARRKCVNVYVLTENTDDAFVYIDGQYVEYDSDKHADMQRFECRTGYIGQMNEVSYDNGTKSELTIQDVTFIRERSAAVLRTIARGTISEMTSIITNATVGDIIEAEPGTMLDKDIIKEAKITQLGNVFKDILTTMTIGELMTWSNVNGVDKNVRAALDGVTINALFSSLVFDEATGEIKVDIPKIYGYDTKKP